MEDRMSIIADMSEPERQSWITLLADGFVFVWFWKAMAPGWSLTPENLTPSETGSLFLKLVIVVIFYHIVISAFFALRSRHSGVDRDERDLVIQSFGTRIGYLTLQFGLGVIIVIALASYVVGDTYMPPISLTTPVQFIFALTFVSYVADLMRHGVAVIRYRAT
jgi:hypothetical protein